MSVPEPRSEGLRHLYWREEILQVMYWIEGEGFGEDLGGEDLERFLGLSADIALPHLERLADDGYLARVGGGRYRLTEMGRSDGARAFADEFAELTRPGHGECGPECWCHVSQDEAEACADQRSKGAAR